MRSYIRLRAFDTLLQSSCHLPIPLPECSVILLAGHDTIATTLTWFLWEIASHPESQERIRAEIKAFRARKGEEQPSVMDLDNMAYTQAALKVLPRRTMQATFRSH